MFIIPIFVKSITFFIKFNKIYILISFIIEERGNNEKEIKGFI